jgi:hypothetical protein
MFSKFFIKFRIMSVQKKLNLKLISNLFKVLKNHPKELFRRKHVVLNFLSAFFVFFTFSRKVYLESC